MLYAFVLGRVYTLSIAEILAVMRVLNISNKIIAASPEIVIINTETAINPAELLKKLGGVIKILKLEESIPLAKNDNALEKTVGFLSIGRLKKMLTQKTGKTEFGVSVYFLSPLPFLQKNLGRLTIKKLGLELKRTFKKAGISSRVCLPERNENALSSATVMHNQLLGKGTEICVLVDEKYAFVAKTIAVQDFGDYGRRDYQRPVRDMKRGMTPPKLAQMMLNLTQAPPGLTLLDPFCGLGTFVQEGLLLGFKMLGSDIDPKAILGAKTNLEWFCNRHNVPPRKYKLIQTDAREVFNAGEGEISAIVTEGTLGPLFTRFPTPQQIKSTFDDLVKLYAGCFKNWQKLLKKDAKIVICFPAYKRGAGEFVLMPNLDFALDLGYSVVGLIPRSYTEKWPFLKLTKRGTAIYDRKDQIVAREIVIFGI